LIAGSIDVMFVQPLYRQQFAAELAVAALVRHCITPRTGKRPTMRPCEDKGRSLRYATKGLNGEKAGRFAHRAACERRARYQDRLHWGVIAVSIVIAALWTS
jgi:hypothetical protein